MFHIVVIVVIILSSLKWGSWNRWKEFLPTIYYFSFFNMFYQYISYTMKAVWELDGFFINMFVTDSLYTMIAYPCLVVLFLSHYPEEIRMKILYNFKYIGVAILIEWAAWTMESIEYFEGWNLWWTLLFYFIMFPMLSLHYRNPFRALVLSVFVVAFLLISFDYHVL
ncbi:CBO0543 family protein [Rossellomorea aquimaris]|uniref:CBO0543 family protein n=1 Tax=Rossellomorea aquimaris TaxID=189382 RepID=UPI0005C9D463|nr:CBO0543 family protein [Rossellomorea aquimaris]